MVRGKRKTTAGSGRGRLLLIAAPPLLAALVYLNALDNPLVYDDHKTIVHNPTLRDLGNMHDVLVYGRFRPLANLSYALDFNLWELNPLGYHLTNLILHLLVVLLFQRGLLGLAGLSARAAAFAASCFAVHPLLSSAVGYASARAELCAALALLAALHCLRRVPGPGRRPAAWLAAGLSLWLISLGFKEIGAMLPLTLVLYDLCLMTPEDGARRRRFLRLYLPTGALVLLAGIARFVSYAYAEAAGAAPVIWRNLQTQAVVTWRYLALLVLPVGQSIVHWVPEDDRLLRPLSLAAGLALLLLVALLFRLRRRSPLISFGGLWLFTYLIPSAILPLTEPMSEHRVYLASCGFFLASTAALIPLARRLERRLVAAGAAALLVALGGATVHRNHVWGDAVTLWLDAVDKAPGIYAPHYAAADALRKAGDCERAMALYTRAIQLMPSMPDAHNNLGICLAKSRRYSEADRAFRAAIQARPDYVKARNNLARLQLLFGRKDAAIELFRQVLRHDPHNRLAHRQLQKLSVRPEP